MLKLIDVKYIQNRQYLKTDNRSPWTPVDNKRILNKW